MAELGVFRTTEASSSRLADIRRLMDVAFDGGFTDDDWEHTLGGWHVVMVEDDVVISHAAVVTRVLVAGTQPLRTGYVEGVATAKSKMGQGFGSHAMAIVTEIVRRDYEFGALGTGRHSFYERLGWERWQGPTFVQDGDELLRTEEDDNGIMVLRFGPSEEIDLAARLVCRSRSGDDW
jgi:aminoglycoside 2'-N-acetyltransferase I